MMNQYPSYGIQRSGATPFGAYATTPSGKWEFPKPMARIMAEHGIPYVGVVCALYPRLVFETHRKARGIVGTRYIEMLVPCPTGWRFPGPRSIEMGRLAVETGAWIMCEKEGDDWRFLDGGVQSDGTDVVIAIIDTGIHVGHHDLDDVSGGRPKVVCWVDLIGNILGQRLVYPYDDQGHGTH
jgi:subtilisin family serine protease